jgi:hypothetical protein
MYLVYMDKWHYLSTKQLQALYCSLIDKSEYKSLDLWLCDMLRNRLIYKLKITIKRGKQCKFN